MNRRRIFRIGLLYFCVFMLLMARLAYIQLIGTESFSKEHINLIKAAVSQRTQKFVLNDGRGRLLSSDDSPLRDDDGLAVVLFPFLRHTDWPSGKIADILDIDQEKLEQAVNEAKEPFRLTVSLSKQQIDQIERLRVPGIYAGPVQSGVFDPFAGHILGIARENPKLVRKRYPEMFKKGNLTVNTKVGINGLEEAFDPFLISKGPSEIVYHTEANGDPLFGLEMRYSGSGNPYYPLNIRTTIDKKIQQIAEKAVDEAGLKKGGIVLLDAANSNLLAMVSRPQFDPRSPYGAGAKNYMILPQVPGSVFKIVTAAAAIEKNAVTPDRRFNCNQTLYGDGREDRQLGMLTFAESFAQSCNHTFGEVANELIKSDPDTLETFAKRLGFVGPVGWHGPVYHIESLSHFPNETPGTVWKNDSYKNNSKSVAQTAIGQLNVRISPLAMAAAIATIARGGKKFAVRTATAVEYQNGASLTSFPKQQFAGGTITPYAAMKLQKLLREVVKSTKGTGHSLADLPYTVAGKSGTAQTGGKTDNQWFAGYFPATDPKYVLVAVDLDRRSGEMKTYEIYRTIVKKLYRYDHERTEKTTVSPKPIK